MYYVAMKIWLYIAFGIIEIPAKIVEKLQKFASSIIEVSVEIVEIAKY